MVLPELNKSLPGPINIIRFQEIPEGINNPPNVGRYAPGRIKQCTADRADKHADVVVRIQFYQACHDADQ